MSSLKCHTMQALHNITENFYLLQKAINPLPFPLKLVAVCYTAKNEIPLKNVLYLTADYMNS